VADDDGGFIRMSASAYYQAPMALNGLAPAPAAPAAPAPPAPAAAALRVELGPSAIEPSTASVGQDVTLSQSLTPSTNAAVLVDFELYDASGQKVWQAFHDNVAVAGGASFTDSAALMVPDTLPPGDYAVKTGVFSAGWGTLHAWNDHAGTLTITAS